MRPNPILSLSSQHMMSDEPTASKSLVPHDVAGDIGVADEILADLAVDAADDAPTWVAVVRRQNAAYWERMRTLAQMTPICPKCKQGLDREHRGTSGQCLRCGYIADGNSNWQCVAVRVDGFRCQRARMPGMFGRTCAQHVHVPRKTREQWENTLYPDYVAPSDESS